MSSNETPTFTHVTAFSDRCAERCHGEKADGAPCRTLTRQAVQGGGLTLPACGPHAAQVTELAKAEYAARNAPPAADRRDYRDYRDDRADEINRIVSEEMNAQFAEQDRHGALEGTYADCKCGWVPRERSYKPRVSLGVHVQAARKKSAKVAQANIQRRMAETRRAAR